MKLHKEKKSISSIDIVERTICVTKQNQLVLIDILLHHKHGSTLYICWLRLFDCTVGLIGLQKAVRSWRDQQQFSRKWFDLSLLEDLKD